MQQINIPIREIKKAWHWRGLAIAVALLVSIMGWSAIYFVPDTYSVEARVYLDTQSMLKPVLKGLAVDSDVREEVAKTTKATLLSRPNLEKLMRETDMGLAAKTATEFDFLRKKLAKNIQVSGGRQNIYAISYINEDPVLAHKVVETLLALFIENTLGSMHKDTSMTENFLDRQIIQYEGKLRIAEEQLKEFKRNNVGFMPTETGGYYVRYQQELELLQKAQLSYAEIERKRDKLKQQMNDVPSLLRSTANLQGVESSLNTRINALEVELDKLLLQYTDKHPDVRYARGALAELEQQKKKQIQKMGDKIRQGSEVSINNPVYQELKISLSKIEAELSALVARVHAYQKRVDDLKQDVDTVPQVEAELARLNRDYFINKKNYESLVSRREATIISREAEQSVDAVQFKIIDPPRLPLRPDSPNRPLLVTLALAVGLGIGVGLAWLMTLIRPMIKDEAELAVITGLPVLGEVTFLETVQQRKISLWKATFFYFSLSLLLVMYCGIELILKFKLF
ncbi:Lipopolysaccharide biosynthesis chain length determinant protein [hydrothermal vent metagenome]|uniref:Lipopolysaccharide biosynthesis chain length determinant protein n=1 Tax=hydrothermal vent metagenome TaxID=652676 RepID=A0A3B0ZKH0_9ZZZZ